MSKYILQSEKEHFLGMQKPISDPTKVHSTAVPLRRQLWVATSHSRYQGGNPTSTSNNNISIQRPNLRATLAGVPLWLWQLPFLSHTRDLARRPYSLDPPAKAAAKPGLAICAANSSFPSTPLPAKPLQNMVFWDLPSCEGGSWQFKPKIPFHHMFRYQNTEREVFYSQK